MNSKKLTNKKPIGSDCFYKQYLLFPLVHLFLCWGNKNLTASVFGILLFVGFYAWMPVHASTYHVNMRHSEASDANAGTADKPLQTIGSAVAKVNPGDTVLIYSGIYREKLVVSANGNETKPIVFSAAPGAHVVVTGADRITSWRHEQNFEGNVYSTEWSYSFIDWNETHAHPDDDWHRTIGRCEQVFIDGYLLHHVLRREEMSRGSFYMDMKKNRLYVWSRDNRDLTEIADKQMIEASVRTSVWENRGDHIHVKGLIFRYCANRAQDGALVVEGDHNLIEDCVVEKMNSSGAAFMGRNLTVRRCVFQQNGQLGFGANMAHNMLLTECIVRNNAVKGWDRNWEAGGNKIVYTKGAVIEKSRFINNYGNGIWFDIGNEDNTVRNCFIADNGCGIFYEISYGLHVHDNVIMGNGFEAGSAAWGSSGAVAISSSPGCVVERNFMIGNNEGFQFREQMRSTPKLKEKAGLKRTEKSFAVWNHDKVIRNNVIAYNGNVQIGGWFDIGDSRRWPKSMQHAMGNSQGEADADIADKYEDRDPSEHPKNLYLEKLNITFADNMYALHQEQELFLWGCT